MSSPPVITVSLNPAIDRIVEVPRFAVGEHQRGRLIARTPAGKSVNVSRALAILGVPGIAAGFIGRQELALFRDSLRADGVGSEFIPVDGITRENITIVDPAARVATHIRDAGFRVGAGDIDRLGRLLTRLCAKDRIVVFSGSTPEGLDARRFEDLLRVCMSAGARVAVDTSGPPLRAAARLPLWLIKPNVAELAELTGVAIASEPELLAAARAVARTVATVLVSRGEEGAVCLTGGEAVRGHVRVAPEQVRNTVGCGDCLLAGYIAGRLGSGSVHDAMRHAVAVAAAKVVSIEPGRFDPQRVSGYRRDARVETLA